MIERFAPQGCNARAKYHMTRHPTGPYTAIQIKWGLTGCLPAICRPFEECGNTEFRCQRYARASVLLFLFQFPPEDADQTTGNSFLLVNLFFPKGLEPIWCSPVPHISRTSATQTPQGSRCRRIRTTRAGLFASSLLQC